MKERDNGTRRVIGLEAGGERMSKQIVLCTLFIGVQGIVDHELEVGGRGGRRGSWVSLRHRGESKEDCSLWSGFGGASVGGQGETVCWA